MSALGKILFRKAIAQNIKKKKAVAKFAAFKTQAKRHARASALFNQRAKRNAAKVLFSR